MTGKRLWKGETKTTGVFRQIECMRKLLVAIGVVLVALAAIGKAAEVRDELADAAEEAEEEE